MAVRKYYGLDTDTTLGGSSASDTTVSSQKAIKGYVDGYALHNTASYPADGLKVLGAGSVSGHYATVIGVGADDGGYGGVTAIGYNSGRSSSYVQNATALGANAKVGKDGAIQIGAGTNSESCSLSIGFRDYNNTDVGNYKLLGSTGLIPIERLGGDNTSTADKFLKENGSWSTIPGGWTPPSQTGNSGKFLTTDGSDTSWGIPKSFNLFDSKWSDYILNDQSWLRADTFSWQDGTVYSDAYNHLVADYNGGTSQTETIGSYTITYVLASDGHKITTDETNVANIYNESGVAWYYILDTANQRFKLPRTKWGFVGLRDAVGKYVPETLPAHRHQLVSVSEGGQGTSGGTHGFINASSSSSSRVSTDLDYSYAGTIDNSTYQDGAKVQQSATQMYLYFYVGQFSQTATEQTAGLNTELFNGKVDLDAGNATSTTTENLLNLANSTTKELVNGWGIPDYTAGVSISSGYVAVYDGYIWVETVWLYSTPAYVTIDNVSHKIGNGTNNGSCALSGMFIVGKGSTVAYSNMSRAVFYPLKGVQNA